MRILHVLSALSLLPLAAPGQGLAQAEARAIIALERGALDRWGRGDPQGFLEIYASEITYFDPFRNRRVNSLAAMRALLAPVTGMVKVERYDMIDPTVQLHGDVAVLSYNLASYVKQPGGDSMVVRWNSSSVYRREGATWRAIHSHWSYTQPELKRPPGGFE